MLLPPPPPQPQSRRRMPIWAWIVLGLVAMGLLILLSPVLAPLFLVVLITGIVAMVKNTRTWLRFRSRKTATIITAVSAVGFLVTAMLSPSIATMIPQPAGIAAPSAVESATPSPTPTAVETPAEPDDEIVTFTGISSTVGDSSATTDRLALDVLATVPVKGRAAKTGYDRDQFGQRWLDVDRNGCDTRNDMLAAQLTDVVHQGRCTVTSGTLDDPYTGVSIDFVRGPVTSELVQIDHVVSLSDAWQKGAQTLTPDQRATFANDPLNLLAVSGSANASKRDGDAATWLPKNKDFRCEYVARQVAVKATYGLWVTQAEHDAIRKILETCADEPTPTSEFAPIAPGPVESTPADPVSAPIESAAPVPFVPAPAPVVPAPKPAAPKPAAPAPKPAAPAPKPAAPAPKPAAPPANITYKNCDDVRAHGAAPIYKGEPGYSRKLDRDGDGVGCE